MQKLSILKQICKDFLKRNKNAVDIVLFGSFARGKAHPNDVDICILTLGNIKKISRFKLEIEKKFGIPVHISILCFKDFPNQNITLWKTVLSEGISILRDENIFKLIGFRSSVLFWYSLQNLKPVNKIRFFYALRGRGKEAGILRNLNGEFMGRGTIIVPAENEETIREFFETWKVKYGRRRILDEI